MGARRRPTETREETTVKVVGPQAIRVVLQQFGLKPATVFAEAGLDPALFDDPDAVFPLTALGRLTKICVARTGCEHFGLLVGQLGGLDSIGLAGLLARHSPDVGTALNGLVSAIHLHVGGAAMSVTQAEDKVIVNFDLRNPNIEAREHIEEGGLAQLHNILKSVCGPAWAPSEVWIGRRKPADARPYRRFFKAPLRFDAEQNALVFSRNWLKRRLPTANAELRRLVQKEIDALDASHGDQFPEQVRNVLRSALLTGHGSAEQVAALFCIHVRTLSRRLRAGGTSFHELVAETQYEMACQMLQNTGMEVTQVAAALDYADTSAFTRAFRRWSGTTPGRWRTGHRPN
jgi:AraC-like DNA-binding protein